VVEKLFVLQVSLSIEPDLVRPLDIALQAEGELQFVFGRLSVVVGDLPLEGKLLEGFEVIAHLPNHLFGVRLWRYRLFSLTGRGSFFRRRRLRL